MENKDINKYTDEILYNQLLKFNIKESYIKKITENIKEQIYSIIYNWDDMYFRKALLVIGEEEAKFYEPDAEQDIKSLVVIAIRNSLIENVFSDDGKNFWVMEEIPEANVKLITSEAIIYFRELDLNKICKEIKCMDINDKYRNLANKYPMAWEALYKLGNCIGKKVIYKNTVPYNKMKISDLKKEYVKKENVSSGLVKETQSGINPEFSNDLIDYLNIIIETEESSIFYADCFKMITRNFEKLLKTIEILLENNKIILTSNYLITESYIGKREVLYKAGHNTKDVINKMEHPDFFSGLSKTHQNILREYVEKVKTI